MLAQNEKKEKKRVRWAETDDVLDECSFVQPAAKIPRLSGEGGPASENAGALPNSFDAHALHAVVGL
jgi:hypothetical protein